MQELFQALVRLLKVKSLVTVLVTFSLVYGFICGSISAEQFMTIAAMVFTFYFARNTQAESVTSEVAGGEQEHEHV